MLDHKSLHILCCSLVSAYLNASSYFFLNMLFIEDHVPYFWHHFNMYRIKPYVTISHVCRVHLGWTKSESFSIRHLIPFILLIFNVAI